MCPTLGMHCPYGIYAVSVCCYCHATWLANPTKLGTSTCTLHGACPYTKMLVTNHSTIRGHMACEVVTIVYGNWQSSRNMLWGCHGMWNQLLALAAMHLASEAHRQHRTQHVQQNTDFWQWVWQSMRHAMFIFMPNQ